ncbi:sigma-70 family RNA polymerase sigma factor [Clostridium perfringens]|uniref:Sigma-70 family RNA polymerase sigma factor n=2 Tax=Clostridium perfringens TaxID=1502 RepID=A0A0K2Y5S3_CLOPF|nr:sigma-70 family RNA polymerase sigma factor [Clostridium perfringens]KQC91391.1 RNA polymerase subunit sigma-70 [Clostridium perfringens CP4]MBO3339067.1 sigma-70 family RNA polymerase sigma factor [Clostridium perfringens]MBO3386464.1 sigma-70 family RNA polymerase sigma factor [Clostridium perfringens]MBO3399264.1 sigma-70 family RNA polymerase sigma factor [Clostridium perfringens]MBO3418024.1 sigma-70 family RNA polymerase sigma factor [Clostridium perfringens]
MSELYEKIKLCKLGNKDAIEEVVNSFEKTIVIELFKLKKENSNIYINEYDFQDNKSEVILNILKAIKNMPIEDFKYKTDEAVKKYINITILNQLNNIIKKFSKKTKNEYNYEFDFSFFKASDLNEPNTDIFVYDLIDKLSEKERKIIKYKYIHGKSDVEIGNLLNFSRQHVNQIKNRALKNLKKFLEE